MPIGDIIGGERRESGRSRTTISTAQSGARNAGDLFQEYLNERTPGDVTWNLNYGFIAIVLSALSSAVTLLGLLR